MMHRAGCDVTVIARGDNLAALRDHGLQLQVGHDKYRVDVQVAGHPSEIDWSRSPIIFVAVKSHQTSAVLADLAPWLPDASALFSLQNGVANEPAMLRVAERVHGVSVFMPATYLKPGEVVIHSAGVPGMLDLGTYPHGIDQTDHLVANDLVSAGFDSVPRADIMAWKYRKLLMNLGNAVDASCAPDDDARELRARALAEGEQVLAAAGIAVIDADAERERRGDKLQPMIGRQSAGSSTWQSLARGTGDAEVDYLNGEIVLLGRLHGIATPVNEALRRACASLAHEGKPPRSLSGAEILRGVGG
jgi:2-dehydropantoate 2-reductase